MVFFIRILARRQLAGNLLHARNLFFRKPKPKESDFVICRASPHDLSEINTLLYENYYRDEPISEVLNIGHDPCPVLDSMVKTALCQGHSFLARCKYDGLISGCCINRITSHFDPDLLEKHACTMQCEDLVKYFLFLAYVQRAPELWSTFCAGIILEVYALCVGRCHRSKGLGLELLAATIKSGGDSGFSVIRFDATSYICQKLAQKAAMKMFYDIPYCSYVTETGDPVVEPNKPIDKSLQVYISTAKIRQPKKMRWFF